MKKKIIGLALSAMLMCLNLQALPAFARVGFDDVNIVSESSGTTVTYELSNTPEGESAALVAALINVTTGEIIEINWTACEDVSLLTGEPKTISVSLTGVESGNVKLRHYLWNNLSDMQSLQNFEPSAPEAGRAIAEITSASMNWTAPDDDYDNPSDLFYNIYDDGLKVNESPISALSYSALNLAPAAKYNFQIKAIDSEGAESSVSNIMAASTYMPNTITTRSKPKTDDDPVGEASKDGNVSYAPKATVADTSLYIYKQDNVNGLNCLSTTAVYMPTSGNDPNYTRNISRLGFKMKNPVEENNVMYAYEITYLDRYEENNGDAELQMQYYMQDGNDSNEIYDSSSERVALENDGAWKTYKGTFKAFTPLMGIPTEGSGRDPAANETMIAFWNTRGWNDEWKENRNSEGLTKEYLYEKDYLKVYRFTLIPLDDTYENYKKLSGVSLTIENPSEGEAATIISGLDSNAKGFYIDSSEKPLTEKGGRLSVALSDLTDSKLTFTVKDAEVKGNDGKIELCCYAEAETVVALSDGQSETIPANTWKKIRFTQDTVLDTEYSVSANNELYVSSLRVTAN